MHELMIAQHIIEEAKKQGDVTGIWIEVGELAHAPAEEFEQVLSRLTDWKVKVTQIAAKAKCSCGFEGPPVILQKGHDANLYECPECKAVPELTQGDEMAIREVTLR